MLAKRTAEEGRQGVQGGTASRDQQHAEQAWSSLKWKVWTGPVSSQELTGLISDLSLDIASAHITTFGEKVIDSFYVTDLVGHKISNATRQGNIRRKLLGVLSGEKMAARQTAAHLRPQHRFSVNEFGQKVCHGRVRNA